MRKLLVALIILSFSLLSCSLACHAEELPLRPFAYRETFEGQAPPVALWASRGNAPIVHFLGVTEEQAFEGRHAFKIDITFADSPYYYYGLPVRVPLAGRLTISARIKLGAGNQAAVGFGLNVLFPPTHHSGCGPIHTPRFTGETDWLLVQGDAVAYGQSDAEAVISRLVYGLSGKDTAPLLDRWAIFLYGAPGQRAVVYVDDVRIEGEVPDEQAYLQRAQEAFTARQAAFRKELADWAQQLATLREAIAHAKGLADEAPIFYARLQEALAKAETLHSGFEKAGYASPAEVEQLRGLLGAVKEAPALLQAVQEAKAAGRRFLVYGCNRPTTITREPGKPAAAVPLTGGPSLALSACADEYESVSAIVNAFEDVSGLKVTATALRGPQGVIPPEAIDIRLVKAWFQGASRNIGYTPQKWLIPELLLKDDALVRVDVEKQTNYLRSTKPDGTTEYLVCSDPDSSNLKDVRPIDAPTLQPVDIRAGEAREFWITIHVPPQAKAGQYRGAIVFSAGNARYACPITLTVHPFALQPSRLIYSIYYRATLSPDGQPYIDSERRSEQQYRAEMADLKAHGVLYPTNYLGLDETRLRKQLQIRKEVGLPTERFYNLGYGAFVYGQAPEDLEKHKENVRRWINFLRPWGYKEVYFYGLDEATGEQLLSQKACWAAVQEAGGKTFVACYKGTFEAMGRLLNLAVLAGAPDPEEARKWHSVGSQIFCYANPQVGVEDPLIYRRNFGLLLWKAGYDGAMDYAYQHAFGHVWNDFDDRHYRDHNFTYPTVNGVVGTIQWEGFREGVDDVRYVTTLEQAIRAAPAAKRNVAQQAQRWLEALDPAKGDLEEIRAQIVAWIKRLR